MLLQADGDDMEGSSTDELHLHLLPRVGRLRPARASATGIFHRGRLLPRGVRTSGDAVLLGREKESEELTL